MWDLGHLTTVLCMANERESQRDICINYSFPPPSPALRKGSTTHQLCYFRLVECCKIKRYWRADWERKCDNWFTGARAAQMAAGTNLEDFFQPPDFHLPGIQLGDLLREYGQLADDVWAWATPLVATCVKTAQETWKTSREHLNGFESLSSGDQRRFMNSGLDGAVVFLLLTTMARLILTKWLEPYLLRYFHQGQGHGFSCSFNQMKWLFASSMLSAIWHANSHTFFDRGVPVDVSLLLGTASVL